MIIAIFFHSLYIMLSIFMLSEEFNTAINIFFHSSGTFLLRDSAQEEHLFSVSFRKYGRSLHARIEHYQHRFSFDSHDPAVFAANTVTGLIEHYKVVFLFFSLFLRRVRRYPFFIYSKFFFAKTHTGNQVLSFPLLSLVNQHTVF